MRPSQPAPMRCMVAHITPLEAPIVWLAFLAGAALGALMTWRVMSRRNPARD
jgi:Na+-driven multidrug efflux pump